ncbi:DNA-methyltransferase [Pseudomonas pseudonitroreducens]|uniref:DNA-methyltransferase n=1 Tax=Pseudomonas pseudonitroreducens TaxID=2892326 RepID=UPI001F443616|nr:site-specific DNA-methyltransferase [Pseudomonas pseudonitroreducens]
MPLPYTLHLGDCLEVLRTIPDNTIDSVVTDPPYGLAFMGKRWDYDVPSVEVWTECLRVLKPGGHLLAFAGTRTQHRMACRIEDAGFELRDMIAWVYGSGFPKSKNLDGDWQGWGTALKPALEPITVARKPLAGTVAANALAHGTGALHIDACRIPAEPMQANTGSGGLPRRREHEQRGPGLVAQPHAEGRWPANLIHDGSDEVLAAFPDAPGQMADASLNSEQRKTQNVYGAMRRGRKGEASANSANGGVVGFSMRPGARRLDAGSAARFFYCAKTSRRDRNEGCDQLPQQQGGMVSNTSGQHMTRRDGYVPPAAGNHHPTVKPTDLMAYLCRLVTRPGGAVLDPFMGSGSTGKACMREGFEFIGIEREAPYLKIAEARIAHELDRAETAALAANESAAQLDIFNDTKEPAA